jgi:hypothetical protein
MKAKLTVIVWSFAVMATVLLCLASYRLREASQNSYVFNVGGVPAPFSRLVLFSFGLYTPASYSSCINNLRQIDGAKEQWALETGATSNAIPNWQDLKPYLGRGTMGAVPACPMGGRYIIGAVKDPPRCTVKEHRLE